MKDLDREVNGYLKFDANDLMSQMNSAFEGKKAPPAKEKKDLKNKEQRLKAIMAEAAQLDPILEENNDMALAVYKPNMTLAE